MEEARTPYVRTYGRTSFVRSMDRGDEKTLLEAQIKSVFPQKAKERKTTPAEYYA